MLYCLPYLLVFKPVDPMNSLLLPSSSNFGFVANYLASRTHNHTLKYSPFSFCGINMYETLCLVLTPRAEIVWYILFSGSFHGVVFVLELLSKSLPVGNSVDPVFKLSTKAASASSLHLNRINCRAY